ncbi:MAG: spore coat associated protein CotJA [Clostridiales bacterium]|nr:spore coat associated protein CotJA [Clostridiales bacterium]
MFSQPSTFPAQTPPAMAYVPYQNLTEIFEPEQGLECGTIFPELNKPWFGRECGCR